MDKKPMNDLEEMFDIVLPAEANLQLPDSTMVNYYQAYKNRYIYIDKEIDETLFQEIKMIINWNKEDEEKGIKPEDRKPIKIFIHSYGGNIDSTFSLIDVMAISKTPIWTINLNCAMSAGGLILINGHKGHRYCLKNSVALVHSGSSTGGGSSTFEQVVASTENYKKLVSMMRDNILEHTTISKQLLTKKSKLDWYIYAEDQIKHGLVDHIVTDINEIL